MGDPKGDPSLEIVFQLKHNTIPGLFELEHRVAP